MRKLKPRNEKKLARIMAYDLCAILDDAERGDLTYLLSFLSGDGMTQYNEFDDAAVEAEWKEGEYGGPSKKEQVESSPTYAKFPYVRQLWDKGDARFVCVGGGPMFVPGDPEYERRK